MQFIPYERIEIKTHIAPELALRKLEGVTELPISFWKGFSANAKPYKGKITGAGFEIQRRISYRNSFLPMIRGEIEPNMLGSIIHIRMNMRLFVNLFILVWCGFNAYIFLGSLIVLIGVMIKTHYFSLLLFAPLGIPFAFSAFAYGLAMIGFKTESNKSRTFLRELFQAYEVVEINPFQSK